MSSKHDYYRDGLCVLVSVMTLGALLFGAVFGMFHTFHKLITYWGAQ